MTFHRWIEAELCGFWLSAWLVGKQNGFFLVEFGEDGPVRKVWRIRENGVIHT